MAQPERRRLKRFVERVSVHFQSGRLRGHGYVRNLSKEGLFIRSERLPEPGSPIHVQIETHDGQKIELGGVVRWTTAQLPQSRNVAGGFGVRLDGNPSTYRQLFEALLFE